MNPQLENLLNKSYRYVGCSADFCDDAWLLSDNTVLYFDLEVFNFYLLKVTSCFRILCEIAICEADVYNIINKN